MHGAPEGERRGPGPRTSLSKAGVPCLGGTASPRHQSGGPEDLMEGLKAQPRGAGSEGSASPGEGLVSEPGKPGLAFLSPDPKGVSRGSSLLPLIPGGL